MTGQSGDADDPIAELNFDPHPIFEERESAEQVYKQKVYLRQLQPPTPAPVEIQVQEVLIPSQSQKPPIHVHVGHCQPRTPSPIVIKTAPPQPPPPESDQPVVYDKYVPPPKQPPPTDHHPSSSQRASETTCVFPVTTLPIRPKRFFSGAIVVERWLPYKPAPKRIIKHSLPAEALQTAPPPHNIIVAYSKPRAVIEVELVRFPVVKIDPHTYQEITAGGSIDLSQHPSF